jgi:L-alanine-DL-glutamate epimerase-like enolase superfamily enzyme
MDEIARVDVYGHDLTYAHGTYVMSGQRSASAQPSTLVRITTARGLVGWGETCPLAGTYLPTFAGAVRAAVAELAPALLGADPTNLSDVNARMDALLLGQPAAKSALDMACWDLFGRTLGVPVSTLLGGRVSERFPLYVAVPLDTPAATRAFITARWAEGTRHFQLKLGNDPYEDAGRTAAALEVTGDEGLVVADANGGWSLRNALIAARLLEPLPVHLEQPCRAFADCVQVRRATTLPMIYDESVTDAESLLASVRTGGGGAINLKLSKVGGLTRARQIRDLAIGLDIGLTIEDTWGGDVVTAAVSQLASSTPSRSILTVSFFNDWTQEHVAGYQPRSDQGFGSAPTGPGLGIEVDAERLGAPLLTVG